MSYVAVARAPIEEIEVVRKRMGWKFCWVSSYRSDFNYDFHVSFRPGIADPEGQTVGSALRSLGYESVSEVRSGKLMRISFEAVDHAAVERHQGDRAAGAGRTAADDRGRDGARGNRRAAAARVGPRRAPGASPPRRAGG